MIKLSWQIEMLLLRHLVVKRKEIEQCERKTELKDGFSMFASLEPIASRKEKAESTEGNKRQKMDGEESKYERKKGRKTYRMVKP